MSRKTKQLIIDNKTFKNTNGTKTRIQLLSNNKVIPYKKDLWKSETLQLFSTISIKKYGKMHTRKKNPKKIIKNKTVKKKSVLPKSPSKSHQRQPRRWRNKSVKKKPISPKSPSYSPTSPTIKKNKTVKKKSVKKKIISPKSPSYSPTSPTIKKNKTPTRKSMIKKLKSLSRMRSYSPAINKEIERLSISPHKDIMGTCKENEMYIPLKTKVGINGKEFKKCMGWKSKKAQKYLLDNLKSKKKIIPANIRGPFQNRSNCWFNSFFMMFFISDKGRKFMKAFRESMITGKFHNTKKTMPVRIQYPFWLLNKMITASLIGDKDPESYWRHMDTNSVIKEIYKKLKKYNKGEMVGYTTLSKPGQSGNPIAMYLALFNYFPKQFKSRCFGIQTIFYNKYNSYIGMGIKESETYKQIVKIKPHIIILEMTDKHDQESTNEPTKANGKIPGTDKYAQVKDYEKKIHYKFGDMEYTLDSMGIRDINQHHICALITLNKKDYMFDGENNITIQRQDWKKLLNKNQDFKITPRIPEIYNLTKGYQCLLYYRSK